MEAVSDYIYHSNAATPAAGEDAFRALSIPIAFARFPLEAALHDLQVPRVSFLYGDSTWMDPRPGQRLVQARLKQGLHASFSLIRGASHHIYIDNVDQFNAELLQCLQRD